MDKEDIILYHYYDEETGPFRNLSDLTDEEANTVLNTIKETKKESFAAKRDDSYMKNRRYFEDILRKEFIKKGGIVERNSPHYMVIGECDFLKSWFLNPKVIKIPLKEFDLRKVSFTYGDSHPTFSNKVNDGKEYRKKLYNFDEIIDVINRYGLPQDWNKDGTYGPERYVEVHIWSDEVINKYRKK